MNKAFLKLFVFLFCLHCINPSKADLLSSVKDFFKRGQQFLDPKNVDDEYDFIVVGAGTAGCALAARLSENPNWKILLIEAGESETEIMDIPILTHLLQLNPAINWNYKAEPSDRYCLGVTEESCKLPRGKVMGGSSVLNYMIYTRGNRRDYDRWAELGNDGWSYDEVLPYFKKLEGSTIPDADAEYVGRDGPVKVSYVDWKSSIAHAFVNALQEDGSKKRDYNGHIQKGVSYLQTTTANARRWSSNKAYLQPLKGKRPNLHIRKHGLVTNILIHPENKTAYGVVFKSQIATYQVKARIEVIVSAGAINTPQLLMLSGIGPADHLNEVGIEVLQDLKVGYNLQDHFAPLLTFLTNASSLHWKDFISISSLVDLADKTGPIGSPGGVETLAFLEVESNSANQVEDGWPDIELFQIAGGINSNPALISAFGLKRDIYDTLYEDVIKEQQDAFVICPMILRPRSRGRISLRSNDPYIYPMIEPNYLENPDDLDIAIRGIYKTINLMSQPAFKKINARLLDKTIPACRKYGDLKSWNYWECYIRYFTFTIYHYSGTAKMGPKTDESAVVDPRLRVHGVKNLRVVDASIMPEIISGHPNGPVFMIAEKAADMIKEDYNIL